MVRAMTFARTKLGRELVRLHRIVRAQARDATMGILACELYYSGTNGVGATAGHYDGVRRPAKEKLAEAVTKVVRRQSPFVQKGR